MFDWKEKEEYAILIECHHLDYRPLVTIDALKHLGVPVLSRTDTLVENLYVTLVIDWASVS